MAKDVTLKLRESFLKLEAIVLETEACDITHYTDTEFFENGLNDSDIRIRINTDTGEVLCIYIYNFTTKIHNVITNLRDYPLPWTFSVPSMKIKEKPLEDVLLAIWKKHKNVELIGE